MPRPPIHDNVIRQIEELWSSDETQTAVAVHQQYRRGSRTHEVSLRKCQQIIASAKKQKGPGFQPTEWKPSAREDEHPDSLAYLLRLDSVCMVVFRRRLYDHEGAWARRLRVTLDELPFGFQLFIVVEFGRRESGARTLQREPYTADLEGLLAYQPWVSADNALAYAIAAKHYFVPLPLYLMGGDVPPPVGCDREAVLDWISLGLRFDQLSHGVWGVRMFPFLERALSEGEVDPGGANGLAESLDSYKALLQFWGVKQPEAPPATHMQPQGPGKGDRR